MINEYLNYIQEGINKPDVLFHAASQLTKTLVPRKSDIGKMPVKDKQYRPGTKEWERKAIFAATKAFQAIPFGLERINMLWPKLWTEEEATSLTKGCYLSSDESGKILQVHYYNCTPKKPLYLYTVDSKDFKLIEDYLKKIVEQWYCTKEITFLKVDKLYPKQKEVKRLWKHISKKDWDIKLQKYRERGHFKND